VTIDAIRPAGERPIEQRPGTGWPALAGLRALMARHPQVVDTLLALPGGSTGPAWHRSND
jgi:hypothetical protein